MFNIMLLNVVYTNAINLKMLFLLVCFNLSYLNLKLSDIFMDFIKGLPCSVGKDVIFVVVDRLSKHSHFITLCHLYSAKEIVKLFMDNVSFLYVMPTTIINDGDFVFTSTFWNTLFDLQVTQLCMSSTYHP